MINCEVAELQDYEDDDLRSVERFALAQLTQYCQMHWLHRDEVVGHRSCDKSFTLYRSNFNALKEPVQGLIQNCQTCLSWSRYVYRYLIRIKFLTYRIIVTKMLLCML